MDLITPRLAELLPAYGPWLLFGLAVLETSFVTGLFVSSGLALALGTVLALQGDLALRPLVVAAVVGGALGDSLGFWVGHRAGARVFSGGGRWGGAVAQRYREVTETLGRHPFYSVTMARLVSFVRTLMPMVAGMSDLPYRRFLIYDIPGVFAWVLLYMGVGLLAGESWHLATRILGVWGALAMGGVGAFLWWGFRHRITAPAGVTRDDT